MKNSFNEISLAKFIARYELIGGACLTKITHEDVKMLFPELKRCSFESIDKDPSLVYLGKVALVNDGRKTIPYYIPLDKDLDKDVVEIDEFCESEKPKKVSRSYDYASMSIYELKCLLKEKFAPCKQRILIKKELESRGAILKRKYQRCKEKNRKYEGE